MCGAEGHLLALDWRKAFDSIDPAALLNALRRFGLPPHFLRVVDAIYTDRSFVVKDSGHTSEARKQFSGICQGCPLSPFLFVMVMTVIMHDAVAHWPQELPKRIVTIVCMRYLWLSRVHLLAGSVCISVYICIATNCKFTLVSDTPTSSRRQEFDTKLKRTLLYGRCRCDRSYGSRGLYGL